LPSTAPLAFAKATSKAAAAYIQVSDFTYWKGGIRRVATLRQSLSLANMISILLRRL
jgi:hypothetical protein